MEPILAARLVEKDLTVMQTGLFFGILPVLWIISCFLIQYLPKKIEKRALILFASLLSTVALLCMGPSSIPDFSDSLIVMIIGQAMFGSVYAFIMIPSLLESLEVGLQCFP